MDLIAKNSGGLQLVGRPQARPAWYPTDRVRPVRVEVWWRYVDEVAAAARLVGVYAPGQSVQLPLNPVVDRDLIFSTVTISSDGLRSVRELGDATEQTIAYARDPVAAGGDLTGSYPNPTIKANAVTYAKMQDVSAAARLLGRGGAGGPGDPQELGIGAGLSLAGTVLSATAVGGGAPTGPAGGDLAGTYPNPTVAPNAVTYAKLQDVSAPARLLGRGGAGGPGDPEELSIGAGLSLAGTVLSAPPPAPTGPLGPAGGDLAGTYPNPTVAPNAVTYAKLQDVSAAARLLGRGSAAGAGDPEELTIGAGLSLAGTVLSAPPPTVSDYTAKLTNTTAFVIPANQVSPLNFNTEVYDAMNMHDASFPSAFIARATGKYLVTGSVQSPGAASGYFQLRCTKNRGAAGEAVVASQTSPSVAMAFDCGLAVQLDLVNGDYVELLVVHNGPASVSLPVLSQTPIFCIARLS
jgi:hypothetical protein